MLLFVVYYGDIGSMLMINRLLDNATEKQWLPSPWRESNFRHFICADFCFLSHQGMINSWIQQQASSQFITLAGTDPLKKALKCCHVVLQSFFRPPNRTHILNRTRTRACWRSAGSLLLSRLASTPGSSASDRLHWNHQLGWQKEKKCVCVYVRVCARPPRTEQMVGTGPSLTLHQNPDTFRFRFILSCLIC